MYNMLNIKVFEHLKLPLLPMSMRCLNTQSMILVYIYLVKYNYPQLKSSA